MNYPKEVYIVEVDEEKQQIVVKTTIKKYYKRIDIPDIKRMGIELKKGKESWIYKNNTLIISVRNFKLIYKKFGIFLKVPKTRKCFAQGKRNEKGVREIKFKIPQRRRHWMCATIIFVG